MAIVFIIPGFIIICITERIIPKEKTEYNLKIFEIVWKYFYSEVKKIYPYNIPIFNPKNLT